MERSVLHCDANKFYASVECLYHPEIRDKPVVVGGSEETRHGIVLTGNEKAKKLYGIKTGIKTCFPLHGKASCQARPMTQESCKAPP